MNTRAVPEKTRTLPLVAGRSGLESLLHLLAVWPCAIPNLSESQLSTLHMRVIKNQPQTVGKMKPVDTHHMLRTESGTQHSINVGFSPFCWALRGLHPQIQAL